MVTSVFRYLKLLTKLTIIMIIFFIFLTFQNRPIKRHRIRHFQIWNNILKEKVKNIKYLLIWSDEEQKLDYMKGHNIFAENKCIHNNCFFIKDRNNFGSDYKDFDAILITAKNIYNENADLLLKRSLKNLLVFTSLEPSSDYPICDKRYDDFFNLTWTYKLDSDIVRPYFTIINKNGNTLAPKSTVDWMFDMDPVPVGIAIKIKDSKRFPVAWFVSNCRTSSRRERFFYMLKFALRKQGIEVDVVGKCGTRVCPLENDQECLDILKQYYFYLAFESAISEDYVTEKVLKPLLSYTVPVVFGGAEYSRFLPPNSYINAYKLGAVKTADKMAGLLNNMTAYLDYFRWHNYYSINNSSKSVCDLCEKVNMSKTSSRTNFREWWNPKYEQMCDDRRKKIRRKTKHSVRHL